MTMESGPLDDIAQRLDALSSASTPAQLHELVQIHDQLKDFLDPSVS